MDEQTDAMMDAKAGRAILAICPFPPIDLSPTLSQLGGLPILAPGTSWPRASDGAPLHFLARIDCSELPDVGGALPSKGMMQFFARIDDEMVWGDDAAEHCRVLYADDIVGEETSPPEDLGSIMGGYHAYDREMRLPDEQCSRTYPCWPLVFRPIRSWPLTRCSENIEPESIAYRDAVDRARAAEIVRTTGLPTNALSQHYWGEFAYDEEGRRCLILPRDVTPNGSVPGRFPQIWIIAERIARAMACAALGRIERICASMSKQVEARARAGSEQLRLDTEAIARDTISWVTQAKSAGLATSMSAAEAEAFRDWMHSLGSDPRSEIYLLASEALKRGMSYAVKYCAAAPDVACAMPPAYMNYLEDEHLMTWVSRSSVEVAAPDRRLGASHHQLLGHAPTSQEVNRRSDRDVLLLHLVSEAGVDFMFCDAGEIEFWIHAADLAARRFDRVWANTQGG